jgi:hypothetical protein
MSEIEGNLNLMLVGVWADLRGLRWSAKSIAAVVAGYEGHDASVPRAPLPVQEVEVQWVDKAFRYLGVPLRPYRAHQHADMALPLDKSALARVLGEVGVIHRQEGGRYMVMAPLVRDHLLQRVYAKFLYASAVVAVDCEALDKGVRGKLRGVMGLPPTASSLLLHNELRILPAELQADRRALRLLAAKVGNEWWHAAGTRCLQGAAEGSALAQGRRLWFQGGPDLRWQTLMVRYRDQLFPGEGLGVEADPRKAWQLLEAMVGTGAATDAARKEGYALWRRRVEAAVQWGYTEWVQRRRQTYSQDARAHLDQVLCSWEKGLPAYLAQQEFLGVVGLRWKLPALGLVPKGDPVPACFLCGESQGECSKHLLKCKELCSPVGDPLGSAVASLRQKVESEMGGQGVQSAPHVERGILRLAWANQQPATLTLALRVAYGLLNRYRRRVMTADPTSARRIWPLRVYGAGSEDELSTEDTTSMEDSESEPETIADSETGEV